MARKDVLKFKLAAAQSLSTSFTTSPTTIRYLDNISYQINVTTTDSTGTFAVQVSDDYSPGGPIEDFANTGTWSTLPLSGTPTVSAANDTITIDISAIPFTAIRLSYTSTVAGTGVADIWITSKQLGG